MQPVREIIIPRFSHGHGRAKIPRRKTIMALAKEEIVELTKKYGKDEKDTGNTKVQIALLTKEIADLTAHLLANTHDYCAKRSLTIHVAKRTKLLTYLKRTDYEGYQALIKDLKLKSNSSFHVIYPHFKTMRVFSYA